MRTKFKTRYWKMSLLNLPYVHRQIHTIDFLVSLPLIFLFQPLHGTWSPQARDQIPAPVATYSTAATAMPDPYFTVLCWARDWTWILGAPEMPPILFFQSRTSNWDVLNALILFFMLVRCSVHQHKSNHCTTIVQSTHRQLCNFSNQPSNNISVTFLDAHCPS